LELDADESVFELDATRVEDTIAKLVTAADDDGATFDELELNAMSLRQPLRKTLVLNTLTRKYSFE
jgi:hypothetical protein